MPLETATDRTIGGDGRVGDGRLDRPPRLHRGSRHGVRARVGLGAAPRDRVPAARAPLLSFIYLRFDLVSVALAAWAIAWTKHRGEALGGAALGLAVMAKLWPLALAPVLLIRRAWRPAVAGFAVVVVVLGAAWYSDGWPQGSVPGADLRRVFAGGTSRARSASVVWIAGRGVPVIEADALRSASAAPWMKGLLFLGLLVCEVAIWRRAAGTDRDPGRQRGARGRRSALTAFSPQSLVAVRRLVPAVDGPRVRRGRR